MSEAMKKWGTRVALVGALLGPGKLAAEETLSGVDQAFANVATECADEKQFSKKSSSKCNLARVEAHQKAMDALAALKGEGENMSMDDMTFGEDDGDIFANIGDGGVSEAKEATAAARQKTAAARQKTAAARQKTASEQAKTASEQAKTVDLQEAADLAKSINSKS